MKLKILFYDFFDLVIIFCSFKRPDAGLFARGGMRIQASVLRDRSRR